MEKNKNGILQDVVLIRFLVVILLLFCHSFTIYGNGWKFPEGIQEFLPYKLISQVAYAAMLETFVFISGYVFQMQVEKGKIKGSAVNWITKKAKRLLIPSLIFSALWLILLQPINADNIRNFAKHLSTAHLWFLPMLFWCFVCGYIIQKRNWCNLWMLSVLLLLIFVPRPTIIPLRITSFMEYGFYFVLGMYIFKNREHLLPKIQSNTALVSSLVIFIVFFSGEAYMKECMDLTIPHYVANAVSFTYSASGVLLIYGLCNRVIDKIDNMPAIIAKVANYSFAIYVFHQFLLFFIYYHTSIPETLGNYWLPWFAIVATTILSYTFAHFFLKTKVGKWLLG